MEISEETRQRLLQLQAERDKFLQDHPEEQRRISQICKQIADVAATAHQRGVFPMPAMAIGPRPEIKLLREIRDAVVKPAAPRQTQPPWLAGKVSERLKCFVEAHPETVGDGWGAGRYAKEIAASKKAVWDCPLYKEILKARAAEKEDRKRRKEYGE